LALWLHWFSTFAPRMEVVSYRQVASVLSGGSASQVIYSDECAG